MKIAFVLLAVSIVPVCQAVTIPTIAGALSIASSSGTIIREAHDLTTHFKQTMRKHGADLKKALKGKK